MLISSGKACSVPLLSRMSKYARKGATLKAYPGSGILSEYRKFHSACFYHVPAVENIKEGSGV